MKFHHEHPSLQKILVTGGAGFIGNHLVAHLLRNDNVRVVVVDNFQRGVADDDFKKTLDDPRVSFLALDLTDPASYKKIGNTYDHVYHLAAVNGTQLFYEMPHEVLRINSLSLLYMLEWFRKENDKGKFCFTSSNEAYAGGLNAFGKLLIPTPEEVPLVIEDPYNPRWSYAATKLFGELCVIHYAQKYNLRALVVRPHNFYGPRAGYNHVIPDFLLKIIKRIDPFPILGAENTRTFCYIEDAVRAMQLLMDSEKTEGQPIQTVHIGDSEEITMRELAERLFKISGWHPMGLTISDAPIGSVKRRRAEVTKLQELTGWSPKVSLDEGLRRTHEWYQAHAG